MMIFQQSKIDNIFLLLFIVCIGLFAVIFTISPMNGEDYSLTRYFENESFLTRLKWIFYRSHAQIHNWNARFGEQLAIFWLSMPKIYFIIASILTFIIFNVLVAALYSGINGIVEKTIISTCLIFSLWPGMEVFFWGTANAGYFQPIVLMLICMFFYSSEENIKLLELKRYLISVSIIAFLAGLSFENTPLAVIFFMLLSFLQIKNRKERLQALLPVATMFIGWLVLITAHSTTIRRVYYKYAYDLNGYSLDYIIDRITDVSQIFISTSSILFGLSLVSLVYVYIYSKNKKKVLLTTVPAILVVGSTIVPPYTEPRSFILAWSLMLATVVEAIYIAFYKIPFTKILVLIVFFISLFIQIKAFSIYADFSNRQNQRDYYIRSKMGTSECLDGVKVKMYKTSYDYKYLNNRDAWFYGNPGFVSKYYDCKIIMD